jgi:hypothetical protein
MAREWICGISDARAVQSANPRQGAAASAQHARRQRCSQWRQRRPLVDGIIQSLLFLNSNPILISFSRDARMVAVLRVG